MAKPWVQLVNPTHRPLRKPRIRNLAPPMSLAAVAANTPEDVRVSITDSYVERIDWSLKPELVGITSLTASAAGAIRLAKKYRSIGVKVVMGGIHPTATSEQMLQYCDAVVRGEAENTWPGLIRDFLAGKMQRIYSSDPKPDLADYRWPRRDLLKRHKYLVFNMVETSRGCPFNCMYCTDWVIYGPKYRFRPVQDVVEEIRSMRGRFHVFLDNNIVGNPTRAKELFEALIPLRIKWVAQASITMAYDEELVRLAKRSGCLGVLVGLETLNKNMLKKIGKPVDPARYISDIALIQKHGIFVQGEFIFGFDEDDESVFLETLEFAERAKLASARFAILKPYPGTRFHEQCRREGRLGEQDWSKYHSRNVAFTPMLLTARQLQEGRDMCDSRFATVRSLWNRVGITHPNAPLIWAMNLANYRFRNSRSK